MRREERDEAFERLLGDDTQAQSGALAEFVDGTREAFVGLPSEERSQEHLTAIVEVARSRAASAPLSAPAKRRSKRMISVILGTLAGKVAAAALGLGVATAAMASTNTLPAPAQDAVANAAQTVGINLPGGDDEVAAEDEPEQAQQGKQTAEAKKEAANAFTTAKKAWTACVSDKAQQHEGDEGFDPEGECGEKPRPQDFGLTDTPEQAEQGKQRAEDARNSSPGDAEDENEAGENEAESDDASDQRDDRADDAEELGADHSDSGNAPEGVANGGGSNGSRGAR